MAAPTPASTQLRELQPHECLAVETYFEGDAVFYRSFYDSCVVQFVVDVAEGDAACQAHDAPVLRRTAHSLKSVLTTLGHEALATQAKSVEQAAQQEPWQAAVQGWCDLRAGLQQAFQLVL